ncbi:MAG: ABC-ATPase domain-containing protein, partial [Candidatus Eisenbacteria bacterium]|nr:ABC-ATPase domain-containing protein [Candidatus Eisenbacteria bacterium]
RCLVGSEMCIRDRGTTAIEDFLARRLHAWLREREEIGSIVGIDPPSQQILRRTALRLAEDRIELLLEASLPARGRRIEGRRAAAALAIGIPRMIRETLFEGSWDAALLARHRAAAEDHAALQSLLARRGWVAFLADGSRLARRSGEEDVPLEEGNLPLEAPDSLAGEVALPHAGRLRGLAIPRGITLLSGGGFHGKSTVLRSLAAAVWPHVPGDGRERVATDPTAMMIRAEDGRSVHGVDLSPFLRNLPGGRDVRRFTTANASGATSQAASIVEAIAAGCRCLLIDEDTSATNFLLRDPWMARLLRPEQEPIVPLLSRLREMYTDLGISTVLVVGGSGEAFRAADRVVVMDAYRPVDETRRMVEIRREMGPGVEPPRATWPEPRRDLPLDRLRARDPR